MLQIRCPACGQRFKVEPDFRDRMVECGACDHRFRVDDEVIVRTRRYYPGERRDPSLTRFQRVPMAAAMPTNLETVQYANHPDPAHLEPTPPQRVIAAAVGVVLMILVGLLLIFGSSPGGPLDGTTTANRLVMAGFALLLGGALLVYGNPKARGKALAVATVFGVALLALPLVFTTGTRPEPRERAADATPRVIPVAEEKPEDPWEALRHEIGTDPLVQEIARLAADGGGKTAVGIWLRNLTESNRIAARDFLLRVTGADPAASHIYPRYGGDYLMVLSGISGDDIPEIAAEAGKLGKTSAIHDEISVIEVAVDNSRLSQPPSGETTDETDAAFFEFNKRDLESLDPERVAAAARRLAEAEPRLYRDEISRLLMTVLEEGGPKPAAAAARALRVWTTDPHAAGELAARVAVARHGQGEDVPQEIVGLAVVTGSTAVIPVLDELWQADPQKWEALYGEFGAPVEPTLLARLSAAGDNRSRQAIVRLLGRVGTAESLPVLDRLAENADTDLRSQIEQARASIEARASAE